MPEPWWRLLPQSFASFRTLLENPSPTAGAGIQRRRFSFTFRLISRYASCHHIVGNLGFPPADLLSVMLFTFEARFSLPASFPIWRKQNNFIWLFFTVIAQYHNIYTSAPDHRLTCGRCFSHVLIPPKNAFCLQFSSWLKADKLISVEFWGHHSNKQ